MKQVIKENLGNCPICSRDMISGPSVNEHHFIPKSKGGKAEDKILLHRCCHDFLHRTFTESELAREFNTPAKCLEHESVQKYVKWLRKKIQNFLIQLKFQIEKDN